MIEIVPGIFTCILDVEGPYSDNAYAVSEGKRLYEFFNITTSDVMGSFWVPNLHGKTDALVGGATTTWSQTDKPGVYRGQYAEYCGYQHAHTSFMAVIVPEDQFNLWLESQRRPAPQPVTEESRREDKGFS